MLEFKEFPKIPRLFRDIVITEKLDGTNAQIFIDPVEVLGHEVDMQTYEEHKGGVPVLYTYSGDQKVAIWAGSRNRWISPGKDKDNYGFAYWVLQNGAELAKLGPGNHYGEWFGGGIQRGYGLKEKKFALFNVGRWNKDNKPSCCEVVPVLYEGYFTLDAVEYEIYKLRMGGSKMVPGFMKPEGVVVFHKASGYLFKATLENDEKPKGSKE